MKNRPYGLLARHYDVVASYAPPMNAHARKKMLRGVEREVRDVCDLGCGETTLGTSTEPGSVSAPSSPTEPGSVLGSVLIQRLRAECET